MKLKHYILFATALCAISSCHDSPKQVQPSDNGQQMELSANDTATVQKIVNEYLQLVVDDRADEAVSLLYVLNDDGQVSPISESQREGALQAFTAFDIKGYAIKTFAFHSETDTEVKYALYLKDPLTTSNPPCINGLIKPVRRNGTWYITLANDEGVHQEKQLQNR